MLGSIGTILVVGLLGSMVFKKLQLPGLVGMIIAGILVGASGFNVLSTQIMDISGEIRQCALIIILTRAGLSLHQDDFKKMGKAAVFMSFVPALFEIGACMVVAPLLLGITVLEATLMGCVLAAVSPAVIVPRMIALIQRKLGTEKKVPQLILTGASFDDIVVISLFSVVLNFIATGTTDYTNILQIPVSILSGVGIGIALGYGIYSCFNRVKIADTLKVILVLALSFLLVGSEDTISSLIPFSSLICILSMAITINVFSPTLAAKLSSKYNELWMVGELLLFVLVGASLNLSVAIQGSGLLILLILVCLCIRSCGVLLSLMPTKFNKKEKLFCVIAYVPKATVQAAIGGIPLSMGLACGEIILTAAVVSILVSAPLGAYFIEKYAKKLLA